MASPTGDEGHDRWLQRVFESQAFMGLLGAELAFASPGRCELALTHRPDHDQHSGVMHAGVIAALADNAAGGAASTLMPVGTAAVTVEYKISFVAPARHGKLIARGEVVHSGNTLTLCESRVYSVGDEEETLCAVAHVTLWPQALGGSDR